MMQTQTVLVFCLLTMVTYPGWAEITRAHSFCPVTFNRTGNEFSGNRGPDSGHLQERLSGEGGRAELWSSFRSR